MRKIKRIHRAVKADIGDLITYRALPTNSLEHLDPFLFLNHHGHQVYPENNNGLPFGPHPHRGFETVTFILEGDLTHKDSGGGESVIKAGGIQWMTAGKGLIHAEISSDEFKEKGGDLEILQLWLNLPAKLKMTDPAYRGLQKEDIPEIHLDGGQVKINAVSGNWHGTRGAFSPLTDVHLSTAELKKGARYENTVPPEHTVFFYVVKGKVIVNNEEAEIRKLVEFEYNGSSIEVKAEEDSIILFGHAEPFNEPIAMGGPFVMNTDEEIRQAYSDFQSGKFGNWQG